ncbi:hypothetical protein [Rhodanobacter sp. DHB23]|uniref:hypothetical protein n=1 Tax=Rhodanobacter sp. DHB23 TaxID=2775923 RepID=UPI00178008B4|nr:hypothetical protein [Rhodanobacter sp. DHB23]MBD8873123.1 hypothetical protein [Rhodanobacter sp. DHB23]
MHLLIDMDGVICTEEKTFERALAKPIEGAAQALAALRDAGHQIIIYTARSWSELAMTKDWLERNGVPYDGLHMGKPVADRIIDDRAIPFSGWPAAIEMLSRTHKPNIDDIYLRLFRLAMVDFLQRVAAYPGLRGAVLEVEPMTLIGLNGVVYEHLPEVFFDSRRAFEAQGLAYLSLDSNSESKPDICCNLLDAPTRLEPGSLGAIVMVSCLEHMSHLFEVPTVLHELLAPGGFVFSLTPWNLGIHEPRPDYWRISDAGYRALFGHKFEIIEIEKVPCQGRPFSPLGISCIARKPA